MAEYPDIIVDVRGRGLMVGVEFRRLLDDSSFLLRLLTNQDDLIFVLVGYLFNVHHIRVAPTLSDPQTLRLEPSMLISDAGHRPLPGRPGGRLREAAGARRGRADPVLHRGLRTRADHDRTRVTSDTKFFIYDEPPYWQRELDPPPLKVAWLFHMIDADDLVSLEPDAARLTFDEREQFLRHFAPRANPHGDELVRRAVDDRRQGALLRHRPAVHLEADEAVAGRGGLLPRPPFDRQGDQGGALHRLRRHRARPVHVDRDQERDDAATCRTSASRPATATPSRSRWKRSSGRSANAASMPAAATLAVVGASGNIGQTCAEILAPRFGRTVLLGSSKPSAVRRLPSLQARLPRARVEADPAALRQADVVLAAANAPTPFLGRRASSPTARSSAIFGAGRGPSRGQGPCGPTCS